jgi:hypothetical protein
MRSHERSLFQETNRRNNSRKDITIGGGDYDAALRGPVAALCFSRRVSRASGIDDHVLKREPPRASGIVKPRLHSESALRPRTCAQVFIAQMLCHLR